MVIAQIVVITFFGILLLARAVNLIFLMMVRPTEASWLDNFRGRQKILLHVER